MPHNPESVDNPFRKLTEDFASRRLLKDKVKLKCRTDSNRLRLYCDEPSIVARFASHVRQEAARQWGKGTPVLVRGQTTNYPGMVPGIFRRPCSDVDPSQLLKAEAKFERSVRDNVPLKRFERDNLGALLQHYGFRTAWIDLVDNLWVAAWFASFTMTPAYGQERIASPRKEGTGWLYFLSPRAGDVDAKCIDLREAHHGLSLRLHTQHGWSLRGAPGKEHNLNEYVIATVEFPINRRWRLKGYLGSPEFLFPPKRLDNTFSKLDKHGVEDLARKVEEEFEIPTGALGSLYSVVSDA